MSVLIHDQELNRKIRKKNWSELTVSTYQLMIDAVTQKNRQEALDLNEYFMDEALVCKHLFDQWVQDTQKYLLFKGYGQELLGQLNKEINAVIDLDQNNRCWDRDSGWQLFVDLKQLFTKQVEQVQSADKTLKTLANMKEAWRISHDLDVDYLLGLYDAVMQTYGEEAIGEMYEQHTIKDWFDNRYKRFDVSKYDWNNIYPLLTFLSFEAMHGHLCGTERDGSVEYDEFDDRIELQFDPCGSGGRAYRGEPLEGTSTRMEAPYRYKAMQKAHDFTWNKKGVCTYCAHCCILTEKRSAEEFGYPVRIIEPPTYPENKDAKCKYIIYKNIRDIPEKYYHRIGLEKPALDAPLGSEYGPYRV
ncbi:MAG: hypothetical protein L3J46_06940 [Kangiellaceae bacterium]|nr:hypothetical protein [Kangiellaceae bacterium]